MAKSTKRTTVSSSDVAKSQPSSARASRFQGNMEIVITATAMVAIFLLVNYLGNKYFIRKDFSPSQYYEISEKTRNVLANLPAPVHVISSMVDPQLRVQILTLLKEYKSIAGDKLTFEELDVALDDKVKAENYARMYNFKGSDNVVVFQMRNRSKVLHEGDLVVYESPVGPRVVKEFRAEQQFTGAIQALIDDKPAKVYFLEGHNETPFSQLAGMGNVGEVDARLARENISAQPLNLIAAPQVPADADALVIAGPKNRLHQDEVNAIGAYLERKGKVFLLQDPFVVSGLESTLQRYNIAIGDDVIKPDTGAASRAVVERFADHPISGSFRGRTMMIRGARSVRTLDGPDGQPSTKVTTLMETQPSDYGELNYAQNPARYDEDLDRKGPLGVAAAYAEADIPGETQTGTRLVVVGSSTFIGNTEGGMDFFVNGLNWMLHREYSTGITSKWPQEYPMGVTPLQQNTINWLALLLVPGITMGVGFFVWYARRR